MSWLAILMIVLAIWVAIKVVSALVRGAMVVVVLLALYWFLAPHLGLPRPF